MPEVTREQVVDYLNNLPVVELVDLLKTLEDKWGVQAKPQLALVPPPRELVCTDEDLKTFTVFLTGIGENKISAIKTVREALGLGLGEAKSFVENLPKVLKEDLSKEGAEDLKAKFETAGCKIEIK